MNHARSAGLLDAPGIKAHALRDVLPIAALAILALFLRLIFYTGVFGSDEVTYVFSAVRVMHGDWSVSDYIGATRYGINIPLALFMSAFGMNQAAANLWSLLCSIGEVILVAHTAWSIWGRRAGLLAGLLIAVLPLHVHFAGRMMADAPLAFFITLSFAMYWWAQLTRRAVYYAVAGIAVGMVFWIKEVAVIYALIFAAFPLLERRLEARWLLLPASAAVIVGGNLVFFAVLAGSPLHVVHVMSAAASKVANLASARTEIWFYPHYLLADVRHTFLAGWFALAGAAVIIRNMVKHTAQTGDRFVLVWFVGLLLVFTFTVTSFSPLALIAKQTNYMLIFVGPLCLLGGYFLARIPVPARTLLVVGYVAGGIALAAMEQQAVRNFVANSKATIAFANAHADATVYVPTSAFRVNALGELLDDVESAPAARMLPLDSAKCDSSGAHEQFVIFDPETADWQAGAVSYGEIEKQLGPCLSKVGVLNPVGFGMGRAVLGGLVRLIGLVPGSLGDRLERYAASYLAPQEAVIYRLGASPPPGA